MLTLVLLINAFMALLCLFVAWHVWKLRRLLAQVADTLASVEKSTHAVLDGAPDAIYQGQMGIYQLREQYQQLEPQLQQAQQVLGLLSLGQTAWRRQSKLVRSRSASKSKRRS